MRQQLLTEKAKRSVAWHREIQTRIEQVIKSIQQSIEMPNREWSIPSTENTAEYGAKIVSAYAKFWAATQISRISERASNAGVLAERSMVERLTERESASVNLQGAIEQSRFEIQQAILTAESEMAAAEGALQSIQSDMRKYLGMKIWNDSDAQHLPHAEAPDRFIHRSPGSGTVLERYFANGERAATGELVVLVADISKLWLVGDLRQQDWDLLQVKPGDAVQAEIVGLESLGLQPATIEIIGGIVQLNSGSIRLTASIANHESQLRPGMIARLILDRPMTGIRIPASSVFSNDGVDYVLEKTIEHECTLRPVDLGPRRQDSVQVLSGLRADATIMIEGVFPIASQAFLDKE
jgi:multidrug efflux pump subunit AcrA (membrane-fusion protein)